MLQTPVFTRVLSVFNCFRVLFSGSSHYLDYIFCLWIISSYKDTLSLKKKGAVILVYLGATYITESESENITSVLTS